MDIDSRTLPAPDFHGGVAAAWRGGLSPRRTLRGSAYFHPARWRGLQVRAQHGHSLDMETDAGDCRALESALEAGHWGFALRLIISGGADLDRHQYKYYATPMQVAYLAQRGDIVRALLAAGASPDGADEFDETMLHFAARAGDADLVALLLARGAGPSLRNEEGNTAAKCALYGGHRAVARTLELAAGGADVAPGPAPG